LATAGLALGARNRLAVVGDAAAPIIVIHRSALTRTRRRRALGLGDLRCRRCVRGARPCEAAAARWTGPRRTSRQGGVTDRAAAFARRSTVAFARRSRATITVPAAALPRRAATRPVAVTAAARRARATIAKSTATARRTRAAVAIPAAFTGRRTGSSVCIRPPIALRTVGASLIAAFAWRRSVAAALGSGAEVGALALAALGTLGLRAFAWRTVALRAFNPGAILARSWAEILPCARRRGQSGRRGLRSDG
jgi:hypothetical protein